MLTCEEFASKVSEYLDGHVVGGERLSMWVHSAICGHCRRYLHQIGAVVDLTTQIKLPDPSDPQQTCDAELSDETRQRLLEAFRDKHRHTP